VLLLLHCFDGYVLQHKHVLRLYESFLCLDAGIDVTANQDDELTDKETFQIEFDTKKEQWRVRTSDNVCWKLADASGIQATDDGRSVSVIASLLYNLVKG